MCVNFDTSDGTSEAICHAMNMQNENHRLKYENNSLKDKLERFHLSCSLCNGKYLPEDFEIISNPYCSDDCEETDRRISKADTLE